ncbi:helix-turn-helix domain-containing protein [Streptomyces sp. NPDC047525]|uniref:TetR/AcrR family transcriptional regulator n=1 Tax=Streptomyces sp. NPDC047525 TaxID=3155264 RepID=UPI0033DFCD10
MAEAPGRRSYDSQRRQAQAHQTRVEIVGAARHLFVSRGWAATTMREVAREAGVSVPTVYAAYGNKTGLVRALVDAADLSADMPQLLTELEAASGPERQLAAMAAYDRRLFEHAGDLIRLIREAGRTDAELSTVYDQTRRDADQFRSEVFSTWPADTLRPGLSLSAALDVYAALCNVDVYTTLTVERHWTPARVEGWWAETLVGLLHQ